LTVAERLSRTSLVASPADAGVRLDQFLAARLPAFSRSQIQHLIKVGRVRVSKGRAKPATPVDPGLVVEVDPPAPVPALPVPEPLPLTILYDDEDLVVVDKPAGMVVHPGAGHARGTLVNALLHHVRGLSGIGGAERPGIVHRLDRGTSGVLVVAKHDRAHRSLSRQFQDRSVEKGYVALVWGRPRAGEVYEGAIGRHPRHRHRMSTRAPRGRAALTRVLEVEPLGPVSLVRLAIETGRTHQIRVHLSEAGYPVVGDETYGGAGRRRPPARASIGGLDRPFLHAERLTLTHPTRGDRLTFTAPLPDDLTEVLEPLRRSAAGHAR
jgi:23S rRNA pseudouridine1911/1915/1917 synthase